MDLPTYTSIWRIEKRLYKLYDFNLPMPLPMVQIGVFVGVFTIWVVFLQLIGVPFRSPWHVLYLVPPGVVTYLATRPVIEGKRLTELLVSQTRYLSEPRSWCRLTPRHEPEKAAVFGQIWRPVPLPSTSPAAHARRGIPSPRRTAPKVVPSGDGTGPVTARAAVAAPEAGPSVTSPAAAPAPAEPAAPGPAEPAVTDSRPVADSDSAANEVSAPEAPPPKVESATQSEPHDHEPTAVAETPAQPERSPLDKSPRTPAPGAAPGPPAEPDPSAPTEPAAPPESGTARRGGAQTPLGDAAPLPASWGSRSKPHRIGWRGRVRKSDSASGSEPSPTDVDVAVPLATAKRSFAGSRHLLVLGCTSGSGQTTTALMLGHTLARHRTDRCVAVDVNPGPSSLARRARMETPETLATLLSRIDVVQGYLGLRSYTSQSASRLEVIASDDDTNALARLDERDYAGVLSLLDRFYKVAVFDPAPLVVERVLPLTDLVVLVAPATGSGAEGLAMTVDWLEKRGQAGLAQDSVLVVNGVSKRAANEVEQIMSVASGRFRSAIQVPWDGRLRAGGRSPVEPGSLRPPARHAYLQVASAVVSAFAASQPGVS